MTTQKIDIQVIGEGTGTLTATGKIALLDLRELTVTTKWPEGKLDRRTNNIDLAVSIEGSLYETKCKSLKLTVTGFPPSIFHFLESHNVTWEIKDIPLTNQRGCDMRIVTDVLRQFHNIIFPK